MSEEFPRILSQLRRERGLSQRSAAKLLHISQALLSHYENGLREPGLSFVDEACRFYQVSADYLLGRSPLRSGTGPIPEELLPLAESLAESCSTLLGAAAACPRLGDVAELFFYDLLSPYDRESEVAFTPAETHAFYETACTLLRLRLSQSGESAPSVALPPILRQEAEARLTELKNRLPEI